MLCRAKWKKLLRIYKMSLDNYSLPVLFLTKSELTSCISNEQSGRVYSDHALKLRRKCESKTRRAECHLVWSNKDNAIRCECIGNESKGPAEFVVVREQQRCVRRDRERGNEWIEKETVRERRSTRETPGIDVSVLKKNYWTLSRVGLRMLRDREMFALGKALLDGGVLRLSRTASQLEKTVLVSHKETHSIQNLFLTCFVYKCIEISIKL